MCITKSERYCDTRSALNYFLYEGQCIARFSYLDTFKRTAAIPLRVFASTHIISFSTKKNAKVNNHLT